MSNRVVHFEIHADDLDAARKFYGDVFGWTFVDYTNYVWSPYWWVLTAPEDSTEKGISWGLLKRKWPKPSIGQSVNAWPCTIQIDDYDAIETKILAQGGTVALPKAALPGMAWQWYYHDLDGNIFGIHQPDTNAK